MIKKFEEFINEQNSPYDNNMQRFREERMRTSQMKRDFMLYLKDMGISDEDLKEIIPIVQKSSFYYTPEEVDNIIKRLPGCDTIEGVANAIKTVFFGTNEDFNDWCGNVECPVVRGINGKLLTGRVYLCDKFKDNEFAENEDDLIERGEEWLYRYADAEGVLDDDQPDWVADNWELLDIEEIDLDKEFGWVEEK